MVRAAAKNHAHVGVVVDPADYGDGAGRARAPAARCRRRPAGAWPAARSPHTAAYDAAIVDWLDDDRRPTAAPTRRRRCRPRCTLRLERAQDLRYGENPHQHGARYRRVGGRAVGGTRVVQHGGKELSYLNLFDAEAAWRLVHRFDEPACVIVKHANPCGVAVADDIATAYERANACDPVSAFGGIVAVNRPLPAAVATALGAGLHRGRRGARLRGRRARRTLGQEATCAC